MRPFRLHILIKPFALTAALGVLLTASPITSAAPGAVAIDIGSIGTGVDPRALGNTRRIIGSAIASGAVDSFLVYSPRTGGPIPIEGGLSACAEKGFTASNRQFAAVIGRLKAVPAQPGTFIQIRSTANCPTLSTDGPVDGVGCPEDAKICADGVTKVSRVPPSCAFAACPGE